MDRIIRSQTVKSMGVGMALVGVVHALIMHLMPVDILSSEQTRVFAEYAAFISAAVWAFGGRYELLVALFALIGAFFVAYGLPQSGSSIFCACAFVFFDMMATAHAEREKLVVARSGVTVAAACGALGVLSALWLVSHPLFGIAPIGAWAYGLLLVGYAASVVCLLYGARNAPVQARS